MMHFELKLEKTSSSTPWLSALVMGFAYLFGRAWPTSKTLSPSPDTNKTNAGGLIPMIPYFAIRTINNALFVSIGITAVMLLVFGYVKAIVTGTNRRIALFGAVETLMIGAIAAGVSYGIVKGVDTGFNLGS